MNDFPFSRVMPLGVLCLILATAAVSLGQYQTYTPSGPAVAPQPIPTHAEDTDRPAPDSRAEHDHAHDGHDHHHDHDHDHAHPHPHPQSPILPHAAARPRGHHHAAMDRQTHEAFAQQVDLRRFRRLAVFEGGRAKLLDTLAREQVERIYGRQHWSDPANRDFRYDTVFTYLDLLLNKSYYFEKPMIYVEVLPLRRSMVSHLPYDRQETMLRQARLSPILFGDEQVQDVLRAADSDLRLNNGRNQVLRAVFAFQRTEEVLQMVSPNAGSDQWLTFNALRDTRLAATSGAAVVGVANPEAAQAAVRQFNQLRQAWVGGDAGGVNAALDALADLLPQINPQTYPSEMQRSIEYYYNKTRKFTIGYVGYFLATVLLLIAFTIKRRPLIHVGVVMLLVGFGIHSMGMLSRVLLSGRWPIHNQYESFIAVSWLGVLVGIIFMFSARQWLFGAAAAAMGTCALLFANTVPIPSREVGNVAAILATSRILYIHVNIILFSYGLIGLGFFISLFYLLLHYFQGKAAVQFAAVGIGAVDDDSISDEQLPGRQRLLRDLDRAQMVVLQLAFWLLGVGIMLGAYWADHAWGRWWAWDPKETWALITWIVYLIAIHVRFGVKQRGLVTAWLSVVGFFVMLWTYWGVNLLLAGLHSYA